MIGEQASIPELIGGGRIDCEQELRHIARLRKRVHQDVDPLQVQQHAHEDLRFGGPPQQVRFQGLIFAGVAVQQLATRIL